MTEVRTVAEVDKGAVDAFLGRHFRPAKASFLQNHGAWWHRGDENRWVLLENGAILGYCAVIPTRIAVRGEPVDASWWVDLVIDPAARGRKLQRHFDDLIRARPLTLGFPNALAAAIHRRHGWGVRENLAMHLLPLNAREMPWLARHPSLRPVLGAMLSALGRACTPAIDGATVHLITQDAVEVLEAARHGLSTKWVSTERSLGFLSWRYAQSPNRDQHVVLRSGKSAAVLRIAKQGNSSVGRILELAGPLADRELRAIIATAARLGRAAGAAQITALAASVQVRRRLASAGLLLRTRARSCWHATDRHIHEALTVGTHHWTLGDADHDEP